MDKQKPTQWDHIDLHATQYWMHFCALPAMEMVLLAAEYAIVSQSVCVKPSIRSVSRRRPPRRQSPIVQKRRMVRTPAHLQRR